MAGGRGLSSAKHSFSVIGPMALRVTPTPPTAGGSGSGCCQQKSGNKNCKLFAQKKKDEEENPQQHRQGSTDNYIYICIQLYIFIFWLAKKVLYFMTGQTMPDADRQTDGWTDGRTDRQPAFERHLQFTEMDSEHSS